MRCLILAALAGAALLLNGCATDLAGGPASKAAAPPSPSVAEGSGAVWDCNRGCRRIR
ncbi:hypothetical protein [Vandammella animalimorsus]|uniref:hypothetical protein n=1 Tax=Vandammella animalimorsus TaxID=2029117 RepID=UPI0015544230|nr:hypothetical protein [Vandammella animalimorsus]